MQEAVIDFMSIRNQRQILKDILDDSISCDSWSSRYRVSVPQVRRRAMIPASVYIGCNGTWSRGPNLKDRSDCSASPVDVSSVLQFECPLDVGLDRERLEVKRVNIGLDRFVLRKLFPIYGLSHGRSQLGRVRCKPGNVLSLGILDRG